jgi:hypothetical protein
MRLYLKTFGVALSTFVLVAISLSWLNYASISESEAAANNNLTVDKASYLGDSNDDRVLGTAQSSNNIYLAGKGAKLYSSNQGVGASGVAAGFVHSIDKTTQQIQWSRSFPSEVTDIQFNSSTNQLVVVGAFGLYTFNEDGTIGWNAMPASANTGTDIRVDVANDGTIAVSNLSRVTVYNSTGTPITTTPFSPSGKFTTDIAIHSASNSIIVSGETQKDGAPCTQYRAGWMRAYDYQGVLKWTDYDWDKSAVGNDCADAMPKRVDIGEDGKLYMAAESAGGNSVFRHDPRNLTQNKDANGINFQVAYDAATNAYQTSSNHITYYGRYDPNTGNLEKNQFVLARLSNNNGNTILPRDITADANGNVYIAGTSNASFPDRASQSINSEIIGGYGGQDSWVFKVPSSFASRELSTSFVKNISPTMGSKGQLMSISVKGDDVVVGGYLSLNGTTPSQSITVNPIQAVNAGGEEGFFAFWGVGAASATTSTTGTAGSTSTSSTVGNTTNTVGSTTSATTATTGSTSSVGTTTNSTTTGSATVSSTGNTISSTSTNTDGFTTNTGSTGTTSSVTGSPTNQIQLKLSKSQNLLPNESVDISFNISQLAQVDTFECVYDFKNPRGNELKISTSGSKSSCALTVNKGQLAFLATPVLAQNVVSGTVNGFFSIPGTYTVSAVALNSGSSYQTQSASWTVKANTGFMGTIRTGGFAAISLIAFIASVTCAGAFFLFHKLMLLTLKKSKLS